MCACERPRLPSPLSRTRLRFIVPAALAIALAPLAGDAAFARGPGGHFGGFGGPKAMQSGAGANVRDLGGRSVGSPLDRTAGKGSKYTGRNVLGGKLTDRRPRPNGDGRDPRPPRRPHKPIGPGIIVGVPGGPPSGVVPPTNDSGSGQPPSAPGNQGLRRIGGGPPAGERRYVADEVIVEVGGNPSSPAIEQLARRHRLARLESLSFRLSGTTLYRWRIPDRRSVPRVVRALEADANVFSAQPNYIAALQQEAPQATPAPMGDPAQYALAKLQLPQAHALAKGDNILIAVIDSGIDATHPELAGMIADSFDAIVTGEAVDRHGTGIAGAIVAHARLMGSAPAARILAVRAFAPRAVGAGTTFAILKGLDWAAARGARVINMSFAGPRDPAISRSLAAANARGIVLIAAAGNAGPKSPPLYPAADPNVIAVTATDADDQLFAAANRGGYIAVAAPGVDLLLPAPGPGYQMASGTSFAAAEVSGAVALLLERKPDLDPQAVRRALMSTARDLGPKGIDPQFGAGLVDAYQAILSLPAGTAGQGTTVGTATVGPR